jgi:hypothetical protein
MSPARAKEARKLADGPPKALLTDIDVNWLQTIAEGCLRICTTRPVVIIIIVIII